MAEIRRTGRSAAPGIAFGTLYVLRTKASRERAAGSPREEDEALTVAIGAARDELVGLVAGADTQAGEILAFQVAMLEDEELVASAKADIAAGTAADIAWHRNMDIQIAEYATSDDEYFRARASDLTDIRDRVLRHFNGAAVEALPEGAVIAAEDFTPSRFLSHDWRKGGALALTKGSPTSHVAMLARARHIPMVVGLDFDIAKLVAGREAIVDGEKGVVVLDPEPATCGAARRQLDADVQAESEAAAYARRKAVTVDGTPVTMLINIATPEELNGLDPEICDGIGLVRTELLFHSDRGLPDEEQQYAVYRRILAWAAGRPVIVRTLDAGGDKPIAGLTRDGETNPFLGLRGLRLSLTRPDVFRVQLRALCRAAAEGELKIMLPMVTVPGELEEAQRHLGSVAAELAAAGIPHRKPPLGIMVEVPSAALTPERFPAAFFSIGSNDLTQYVMAAARDLDSVAALANVADPAMLGLIANVTRHGELVGIEVSLCGDAASVPEIVPLLLRAGLRRLSASPGAIGRVKAAIAALDLRM
ncbi:MAG TPA: phosphoenolpyruvate--protein phosphotransferase [Dongiaceae bacterium]|jgi:phosphotransferase system enzyme I (PtsI)